MKEIQNLTKVPLTLAYSALTMVLVCLLTLPCFSQEAEESATSEPIKAACLQTLKDFFQLLIDAEYEAASEHLILPADFKPEMLKDLLSRQEISQAGIEILERSAEFGLASTVFGAKRAEYFANRAGVEVENCYGFNHETDAATAEVIGLWDGSRFKFFRIDDIGKLQPAKANSQPTELNKAGQRRSLPELKLAVETDAADVAARGNYAMALYQAGKFPESWLQLMEGYRLQPDHRGIAKGIGVLMGGFEKAGVVRVGIPQEKIDLQLGPPDKKVDLNTRQRWVYAYLGVDFKSGLLHEIVDLRASPGDMPEPNEILSVDLDGRDWQCGMRKKQGIYATATYFLSGENIANWTEQVEIERITGAAQAGSAAEIGQLVVKQVTQRDPDVSHRILSTDDNSVIVAFVFPASATTAKRYQLVRLLKGPRDVH